MSGWRPAGFAGCRSRGARCWPISSAARSASPAAMAAAIAACSSQIASRRGTDCSTAPITRRRCTQWAMGALADQRVAGGFVDRAVKGDVGIDHRLDVPAAQRRAGRRRAAPDRAPPGARRPGARPARRARRAPGRPARSGPESSGATTTPRPGASCTRPSFFSRRSACSTGCRETASCSRDLLLRQPCARRERALTDGVEQGAVDAFDEIGGGLELDELGGHGGVGVLDSVYRVPRPTLIASPGLPCSNDQAMTEKLMKASTVEAMMIRVTRPLSAP